MIDAEFDIYDTVSDAIREIYGDKLFLTSEYTESPSKFPAVSIIETNNAVNPRMITREHIENAADLAYEVNVFSNDVYFKKIEAKKIMADIDGIFESLNFRRTMLAPTSNLQDATIYRIIARYEATIDRDFWLYQE